MSDIDMEDQDKTELSPEPLYEGDTGRLTFDERQLLVYLLKGPYLLRAERPNLWNTLTNSHERIQSALSDLFLTLTVSEETGIAFCRQAEVGDLQVPLLLRRFELTYLDSVLILEMRERLMAAEIKGERALISAESIQETLRSFDKAAQGNEKTFKGHVNGVLKRMLNRKLLLKVSGSKDMFEISLVLKLLFNIDEIVHLKEVYLDRLKEGEFVEAEDSADNVGQGEDDEQ